MREPLIHSPDQFASMLRNVWEMVGSVPKERWTAEVREEACRLRRRLAYGTTDLYWDTGARAARMTALGLWLRYRCLGLGLALQRRHGEAMARWAAYDDERQRRRSQ